MRARNSALLSAMACGLVGLALSGVLFRREITEWWYVRGLSSANSMERIRSAEALGKLGSIKAIPKLIDLVKSDWKWVGSIAGAEIHYDHIFIERAAQQTTIRFVVDAEGWWVPLFGGIFGRVYRRNLNRAVPLLVQEIEAVASSQPWGQAGERRG